MSALAYEVERWQRQRWHKDTRYYEIAVQQDLWGNWLLVRSWGRRGYVGGQVQQVPYDSYQQALDALQGAAKRRAQRGYVAVG